MVTDAKPSLTAVTLPLASIVTIFSLLVSNSTVVSFGKNASNV